MRYHVIGPVADHVVGHVTERVWDHVLDHVMTWGLRDHVIVSQDHVLPFLVSQLDYS